MFPPWMRKICFLVVALATTHCATKLIPGTQARDTPQNREIYDILRHLVTKMRAKNIDDIVAVVSKSYFEDMGTPQQDDDYGYETLKDKILPKTFSAVDDIFLSIDVHDIVVRDNDNYAHVDIRYLSRAKVRLPEGEPTWDSHKEFNRLIFAREDGRWMVVSGL